MASILTSANQGLCSCGLLLCSTGFPIMPKYTLREFCFDTRYTSSNSCGLVCPGAPVRSPTEQKDKMEPHNCGATRLKKPKAPIPSTILSLIWEVSSAICRSSSTSLDEFG